MTMDLAIRKQRAEQIRGREVRRVAVSGLELRELDGALKLDGWASVTEHTYDMGWYEETIKRGAFAKTLSERPDVQLLLNHEGLPLARTLSGTLQLAEDGRGLHVNATLEPDDLDVQRLAPKVARGDIDQMSFAFRVIRQQWTYFEDDDTTSEEKDKRDILEVNIDRGDVSVVNQGANDATSFSLRDAESLLRGLDRDEFVSFMRSIQPEDPDAPALVEVPPVRDLSYYRARATALRLKAS